MSDEDAEQLKLLLRWMQAQILMRLILFGRTEIPGITKRGNS